MIPKVLHYCWFGKKEKLKLAEKCIRSWKEVLSEYELHEWNEENFDVFSHPYTRWCYENQKWAYLSDYVRLWAIYNFGGIYLDTDVEVLQPLDGLLEYQAYFGFEEDRYINTGLGFGAVPKHPLIAKMLFEYDKLSENAANIRPVQCPVLNTKVLAEEGFVMNGIKQIRQDILLLPAEFLNPLDDKTGRLHTTSQTLSIHWYSKSCFTKSQILRCKCTRILHRWFGTDCFARFRQSRTETV